MILGSARVDLESVFASAPSALNVGYFILTMGSIACTCSGWGYSYISDVLCDSKMVHQTSL